MSDTAIIGAGDTTGMFYYAAEDTELPGVPSACTASAMTTAGFTLAGEVTADGIEPSFDKSTDSVRNWANKVRRTVTTEHTESISVPIMDTDYATLVALVGEDNVTKTAATQTAGEVVKAVFDGSDQPARAFAFRMKDGDRRTVVYIPSGQVTATEVSGLNPSEVITWTATITAQDGGIQFITEDGETA